MTKKYKSPPIGNMITIVLFGVEETVLKDQVTLESILKKALLKDNYQILGKKTSVFPGGGITSTFILAESHLSIHTYTEYNSAVINLYTCRGPHGGEKVIKFIRKAISHSNCTISEEQVVIKKKLK